VVAVVLTEEHARSFPFRMGVPSAAACVLSRVKYFDVTKLFADIEKK
jgi:hypothetical protein